MNRLESTIPPVKSNQLGIATEINTAGNLHYFDLPEELMSEVEKIVKETEVVADIGCGIVPMNYFRPKLHFLIEPWKEYSDVLSYRYAGDKSIVIMRKGALEALQGFADNSVDSIFLLDVIEHIDKDEGLQIIKETERVAREQIVIFTPLGFMPQPVEVGEVDGWGLSGNSLQEHISGWTPEDFSSNWSSYICKEFHKTDYKGDALEKIYGAFFAIRNFENKTIAKPEVLSDIRKPTPSEIELSVLKERYQALAERYRYFERLRGTLIFKAMRSVKRVLDKFR